MTNGGKAHIDAAITISVPANAVVEVVEVADNETVTVVHTRRRCSAGAIDAVVTYLITGTGSGDEASLSVDQVGGGSYGSASGTVGTPVSVNASIPGKCSG